MQLDEFLYNLHFDIDKVRPIDTVVDWADAPLPFKLYQNLPVVPLSCDVSLKSALSDKAPTSLEQIGHFLWHSYGLTKLCHTQVPSDKEVGQSTTMQLLLRHVPSGGGLYPSELYVYLRTSDVAPGIYHYDVAHLRLVLLREGNFDAYIASALGHRCELDACFGTLFVSTMFWKNFYKYNNFAYRLQGLDAGAVIGQLIEIGKQCEYESVVYFQFLDKAINHLLGLDNSEESAYAVIPLTTRGCRIAAVKASDGRTESADQLCNHLVALNHNHYSKSQRKTGYPVLLEMNQASMIDSTASFVQFLESANRVAHSQYRDVIHLPKVPALNFNPTIASQQRFSPALDFVSSNERLHLSDMAVILSEAMRSSAYVTDVDSDKTGTEAHSRLSIACCVHEVDGLVDGAYLYDASVHELRLLEAGDHRMELQMGMTMHTVNLFQVPLCFHLVGEPNVYHPLGYRGYRIQQMEVGMVLQRLLLIVSDMGLGGHPLLGYDEAVCDDIYHFTHKEKTCLIQVPVGWYRKRSRFEGTLRGLHDYARTVPTLDCSSLSERKCSSSVSV